MNCATWVAEAEKAKLKPMSAELVLENAAS